MMNDMKLERQTHHKPQEETALNKSVEEAHSQPLVLSQNYKLNHKSFDGDLEGLARQSKEKFSKKLQRKESKLNRSYINNGLLGVSRDQVDRSMNKNMTMVVTSFYSSEEEDIEELPTIAFRKRK